MILGDNALKYSPDNGTISFTAVRQEDGSVASVADQDRIPEEDLPFIWERFHKVDKSLTAVMYLEQGLTCIAKEIICVHGAKAQVFIPRVGTRFEVTFPKEKVVLC